MPRRTRRSVKPLTVQQVNQKCKMCLLRYTVIFAIALGMMAYYLPYEQNNVPFRPKLLDKSNITIMSYNVRGSNLDSLNTTKWESRKQVALEMINIYRPDIIGLQEPKRNQIETFKQNGYNSYGKFIPTSILYKKDKFKMIDADTLWLSNTPKIEGSKSWDMSQQRVLTWILLELEQEECLVDDDDDNNNNNNGYLIFNTHLDHIGEESRMESCLVIKDSIHQISSIKYKNKYPIFLIGDFNAVKYSNVWKCFTNNQDDSFDLVDALHETKVYGPWKKLQLQYTYHHFHGLQINTWYNRALQYLWFGSSNSIVKWLRWKYFKGVCCMAPSLYRQVFRRSEFDRKAGIHHLDWILYDKNHHKIDSVKYFEVITYHHSIEKEEQPDFEWTLNGFFHQRIISKTIFPSDHFPIIAGFAINS